MATFQAPNNRKEHGKKMAVLGEESKDKFANEVIPESLKDLISFWVIGAEGSKIVLTDGRGIPFQRPFVRVLHGF